MTSRGDTEDGPVGLRERLTDEQRERLDGPTAATVLATIATFERRRVDADVAAMLDAYDTARLKRAVHESEKLAVAIHHLRGALVDWTIRGWDPVGEVRARAQGLYADGTRGAATELELALARAAGTVGS